MTFAVVAGYGIAIYITTLALIRLSSLVAPPLVVRSSACRMPEREPLHRNRLFR
jgi:hypothetical protein